MTTDYASTPPRPALRPLAIPNEHGGWSFLLEPVVLALAAAPSTAGLALATALVGAVFLRHPLRLAARDAMMRKRYPRTSACVMFSLLYGAIVAAALALAIGMSSLRILLPLLVAAPLLAIQFSFDVRNRGRALAAEICGAAAAAGGGAACVIAGGGSTRLAIVVAALAATRSIPSVLYVRALLRGGSPVSAITVHVVALCAVVGGAIAGVIPVSLSLVPLLLLWRCLAAQSRNRLTAQRIGLEEVAWGAGATTLWAVLLTFA